MVKIILTLIFISNLYSNIFEQNCLKCHINKKQLKLFMSKYTLKYSSEEAIKKRIVRFLKYPTSNKSIMPYRFILENGFKDDTTLNDEQLKQAVDIYYDLYNIKKDIR